MSRIPNIVYNFSVYSSLAFLFLLYSLFKERSEEVDLQEVLKEIDEQIKERFSLLISVIKFEDLTVWYVSYRYFMQLFESITTTRIILL
jgi:hypothetical protein